MATIFYDTVQNERGLVTAMGSNQTIDPDHPLENVLDYSTYTYSRHTSPNEFFDFQWTLSRAVPIDTVGFVNHQMNDDTRVSLYDVHSGGSALESVDLNSKAGSPAFATFTTRLTDVTTPRIVISNQNEVGSTLNFGSVFLGTSVVLPGGIEPAYVRPHEGRRAQLFPSVGTTGSDFLGSRVERIDWRFQIKQNFLDPNWVRNIWPGLIKHIEYRPFFFRWDEDYPEDTVYAWTDGPIAPPRYSTPLHMEFNIKCRGLHVQ